MTAADPALDAAIEAERARQESFVELIASENYVSPAVLQIQGSCLTNKYADGYPGRRTYSGCEFVDVAESLARERACELFGAQYANVQPYSGSQANAAALMALLQPGETLLGLAGSHGGHITHGDAASFSGRLYRGVAYHTDAAGHVDYAELEALAQQHRPKVIVAGYSAYSRTLDWERFRAIADRCGAWLLADIAHAAGLIAAGVSPSPLPFADVCTSTTHKTLRGPRGGLILARDAERLGPRLDAAVYPGVQGGPLMHVVAAKAAAFAEALRPGFRDYQQRVLANARRLAAALQERGFTIVTGGTDNHMMLVELGPAHPDAQRAAARLEAAHIAVSVWRLPADSRGAAPRGLRLGTPAVTTRGFDLPEMDVLAGLIGDLLDAGSAGVGGDAGDASVAGDAAVAAAVAAARDRVAALCRRFPVYGPGSRWEA